MNRLLSVTLRAAKLLFIVFVLQALLAAAHVLLTKYRSQSGDSGDEHK